MVPSARMPRPSLKGINVVVTRARPQASSFASLLRSYGAKVISFPTIKLIPPKSFRLIDHALMDFEKFDWLIFTSVNGVSKFKERLRKISPRLKFSPRVKTCAIGPATAREMRSHGIPVSHVSKDFVAESMLKILPRNLKGKNILIPRAAEAREVLPAELSRRGARVCLAPVYRTVPDKSSLSAFLQWLGNGKIDCVTFTSSSTVKNFFSMAGKTIGKRIVRNKNIKAASIGPVTTETLERMSWKPAIIAAKPTTRHLADAIRRYYQLTRTRQV